MPRKSAAVYYGFTRDIAASGASVAPMIILSEGVSPSAAPIDADAARSPGELAIVARYRRSGVRLSRLQWCRYFGIFMREGGDWGFVQATIAIKVGRHVARRSDLLASPIVFLRELRARLRLVAEVRDVANVDDDKISAEDDISRTTGAIKSAPATAALSHTCRRHEPESALWLRRAALPFRSFETQPAARLRSPIAAATISIPL